MTPQAAVSGPDPLEWARKQLDFEAVAKRGPSPREVLFKAQTIVPLSHPRLNTKPVAAGAGALLLLAALLAPWLPDRTVLLTAHVMLDQRYTREQAQAVVYKVAKRMKSDELLGAQFQAGAQDGEDGGGSLRLSFTAIGRTESQLHDDANWALGAVLDSDSATLQRPLRLQRTTHRSPAAAACQGIMARTPHRNDLARPGDKLAQELLAHQDIVIDGLQAQLERAGFKLSAASYLDLSGTGSGSTHDLTLAAWPSPLGVSIEHYSALGEKDREAARASAQEFIERMNLGSAPLALTGTPQAWLPLLVEVRLPSGRPDRFLTDRLQAQLVQPKSEDLARSGFDVVRLVEAALKRTLPGEECRIDYDALRGGEPANRGELYRVFVSLSGQRVSDTREIAGEEEVRDEESIDW